jgi:hypothetical protein
MVNSDDQAQGSEQDENSEDSQSKEETQDAQDTEQSDKQKEGEKETEELFDLPDGRKVDKKTLTKEWKENFYPEFTRRSQKLKDYEKAEEEAKSEAGQKAKESIANDDLLKNLDPSVREAVIRIVEPVIQKAIGGLKTETVQQEKDKTFVAELTSLEVKYPGGDGRPKFDRSKILSRMRESDNRDFDPETVYEKLNRNELRDYEIKEALKKQKGGSQLETTGGGEGGKPQGKVPKTFEEAATAAKSRF